MVNKSRSVSSEILVTKINEHEHMIRGGHLPLELAWVPSPENIHRVSDNVFIRLQKKNHNLSMLCGQALCKNRFFDELQQARNDRCKQLLDEAQSDDFGRSSLRSVPAKELVHEFKMPSYVELDCSHITSDGSSFVVPVVFEHTRIPVVAVLARADVLEFIVREVRLSANDGTRGVKRPKIMRKLQVSQYPEIKWNYTRNSPYVVIRNADGKIQRPHKAPRRSDDPGKARLLLDDAFEELHEIYQTQHVGEVVGDDEDDEANDVESALCDIDVSTDAGEQSQVVESSESNTQHDA